MTKNQATAMEIIVVSAAIIGLFLMPRVAFGQENHAQNHDVYQGWTNQNNGDCCHGQDCGVMNAEDVDETGPVLQIRVKDAWCPVQSWQMLKKGKSPDWQNVHACINKRLVSTNPCDALICFAGKPQF